MSSQFSAAQAWSRREIAVGIVVLTAYFSLSLGVALTNSPWADEAYSASTAWNMVAHGSFATTNIETAGGWLTRIDKVTYWVMPLYLLASAAWAQIFGVGFLSLRLMSITWGLIALFSWFVILNSLSRDRSLALVAVALIGLDYVFIRTAANARFEMQAVALGWLGVAAYLHYREHAFTRSLLIANTLLALSLFTHPNAVMIFALLWLAIMALDARRLHLYHLALSALPFLICLGLWVWFITRDYQAFHDQFLGNARGRFGSSGGLMNLFRREITQRYLYVFLGNDTLAGIGRLKVLILAGYAAGIVGGVTLSGVRRSQAGRFLLVAALATFLMLTTLEGFKNPLYLIYPVPIYVALFACVAVSLWNARPGLRPLVVTVVIGFMVLNVSGIALVIRRNTYGKAFQPMIAFVRTQLVPGELIVGAPELQFGLGFNSNVLDDPRLGFNSGKQPRLLVVDERYRGWFAGFSAREPKVDAFVQQRLRNEYQVIYANSVYQVYEHKEGVR